MTISRSITRRVKTQSTAPTLKKQYVIWLERGMTRNQNPFRPGTAKSYKSQIETNVLPEIGDLPLDVVGNTVLKDLANKMKLKGLSASTIQRNLNNIKDIRKSAKDSDGKQLYPYAWDNEFIDAPIVDSKKQKRPTVDAQTLNAALKCAISIDRTAGCLFALLAGSGARINEALDITTDGRAGNVWNGEILTITKQRGGETTKTDAGVREVDLAPELNEFLKQNLSFSSGLLFPKSEDTYRRIFELCGAKGGFHILRRWRVKHLRLQGVPDALIKFWVGHEDSTVTGRYTEVGPEIEARKTQASRAGLGFQLPEGA